MDKTNRKNTEFKIYWKNLKSSKQEQLAKELDTSPDYLYQIANGYRNAGNQLVNKAINFDKKIALLLNPALKKVA